MRYGFLLMVLLAPVMARAQAPTPPQAQEATPTPPPCTCWCGGTETSARWCTAPGDHSYTVPSDRCPESCDRTPRPTHTPTPTVPA